MQEAAQPESNDPVVSKKTMIGKMIIETMK